MSWLTILGWIRRSFGKTKEEGMEQSQKDSPNAQQANAQGDSAQSSSGPAVVAKDNAKVEISMAAPAKVAPIVPDLRGVIRGSSVVISVLNTDSAPHRFRVRFHGVKGFAGTSRVAKRGAWWINDWEHVGPKHDSDIQIAQASGEDRNVGRLIKFSSTEEKQLAAKLSEYVAFGGKLSLDLEIQCDDAELGITTRNWWDLTTEANGNPRTFAIENL
jgi:hypothetical protein